MNAIDPEMTVSVSISTLRNAGILTAKYELLLTMQVVFAAEITRGLLVLHKKYLFAPASQISRLMRDSQHVLPFILGAAILDQAGMNDRQDFDVLLDNPDNARELAAGLVHLHQAGILTDTNRDTLIKHPAEAFVLASGLVHLYRADRLTRHNRTILSTMPSDALTLAQELVTTSALQSSHDLHFGS